LDLPLPPSLVGLMFAELMAGQYYCSMAKHLFIPYICQAYRFGLFGVRKNSEPCVFGVFSAKTGLLVGSPRLTTDAEVSSHFGPVGP
jgi:hypothetical protein